MCTFAEKAIQYHRNLTYSGELPKQFKVLNPFLENTETLEVMSKFYTKFYNDSNPRKFLIGINPSRLGAGITGVPFTDTKRLESVCGIKMLSAKTNEVSSTFVYQMIEAFGGAKAFFSQYYINSPFPLALLQEKRPHVWLNANYYDDMKLYQMVKEYMIDNLREIISWGMDTDEVIILGKKNARFIQDLNKEAHLFKKMTVLEHPRYIQQYKSKELDLYIDKYLIALHTT
ncbi:MAG: SMUG2 DNA glycosylase family protein [Brumimicrobium sp.]|nr:SMUG2 DNA glycosylase family protein [Brumimicrobium sp.]